MDPEEFSKKVQELYSQAEELSRLAPADAISQLPQALLLQTIEKFHVSLEELQVADEELRKKNDELIIARLQLEAERLRYLELFEFAPDGYLVTDENGKILETNIAACALFNRTPEFLAGKPLAALVDSEDRQNFYSRFRHLKQLTGRQIWTLRLKPKERPAFDASLTVAAANPNGGKPGNFRWLIRDISEHQRARDAIKESEEKFRTLAESISAAIFIVQNGKIRYVNPAATQITEYAPGELLDREFTGIIHPDYLDPLERFKLEKTEAIGQAAQTGVQRVELELSAKSGRSCWVDITIGRMQYERLPALIVTANDITQEQHAKQDRQELLRRLVTVQEEERHRISRELHDQMGQSLTALILGLKSVQALFPSQSTAHHSLQQLHDIADELGQQIHRLAFELRPASLDDLGLHNTLQNYAEEWSERTGIKIDYQAMDLKDERLPDNIETTLYRIVQEALTNVLKHAGAKNVSLILGYHNHHIQAIVEDDGCGFDVDKVLTAGGARRLGILGIKERAELAGGTFNIESEMGKGTTIYIRIPLLTGMEANVA